VSELRRRLLVFWRYRVLRQPRRFTVWKGRIE
jgi:hypothetical protein